jgi:RHS repeat-associated protein
LNTTITSRAAAAALLGLTLAGLAHAQATVTVVRTVSIDYDAYGQVLRETVEPNDVSLKLVTEYERNPAHGVVTSTTLKWRDPVSQTDQTRVIDSRLYDSRKRYPTTITNAKSQSETRAYDERNGALVSLIGPNLLTTSWEYDAWDRKTRESRADGTASSWAYRSCVDACLNGAVSVVVAQNWAGTLQSTVPSEAFADALGRDVATRTWGFAGAAVISERAFDNLGRLQQVSRPYFAGASPVWIEYDYDALGRLTQVREPNATGSGFDTTTTAYNGQQVSTTDAKNHTRTTLRNGMGKLKSVTDAAGNTTSYLYDPFGHLTRTIDPKGNQINVAYDKLGRKLQLADPDLGTWTYLVDPLGQTYSQQDAKSQVTTFTFDTLGRLTRRYEPDLDSYWVYDTAATGVGKLAEAYTWAAGAKDYQRLYSYDSSSRVSSVTTRLDWDYSRLVSYDSFGRTYRHEHKRSARGTGAGGAGVYTAVVTGFNGYGYASQVSSTGSDGSSKLLWTTTAQEANGRTAKGQLGNGLNRQHNHNPYTGRLERIAVGPNDGLGGAAAAQQGDTYQYDAVGNLASRTQLVATSGASLTETFGYDALDRLTSSVVAGQAAKSYGYDAIGNLTTKAGAGYTYPPTGAGSVRPHAVAAIAGTLAGVLHPSFSHDANGNVLSGLNRSYAWTSANHASAIDRLSGGAAVQRSAFLHGPERQRLRQTLSPMSGGSPGAATRTIYYAGAIEKEIDFQAGTTTLRTYLPLGLGYVQETLSGTAVAATAEATRVPRYFMSDRQGSVLGVLDDTQSVLQRMSHDPWGRRRNTDGSDDASASLGSLANAQDHTGYTGQEQLDTLALVHLNGRIYDPITARMTSADPTVPDPADLQALNRYAYVINNPLRYTDPTGFAYAGNQDQHVPDINTVEQMGLPQRIVVTAPRLAPLPPVRAGAGGAALSMAVRGGGFTQVPGAFSRAVRTAVRGAAVTLQQNAMQYPHPLLLAAAAWAATLAGQDSGAASEEQDKGALGANGEVTISPDRAEHILDGDPNDPNSGGHRHGTGRGKSEFPAEWSDEKILDNVKGVANDPASSREKQGNGRIRVEGERDGVRIRVIVNPKNNGVVTAHPLY